MADERDGEQLDDSMESPDNSIILDLESPLYVNLSSRLHPDLSEKEKLTYLMMGKLSLAMREFALLPSSGSVLVVLDSISNNQEILLNFITKSFGIEEIDEKGIELRFERFYYYPIPLSKEDGTEASGQELSEVCSQLALEITVALDAAEKGMTVEEYSAYLEETMAKIHEEYGDEEEDPDEEA
jgi:hypothetical protein